MILKLLGLLDLLTAISLVLVKFEVGNGFILIFPLLVLVKTVPFLTDWNSLVDLGGVILFFLAFYGVFYNFLTYLTVIWWVQKAFMSFIG